jgi:hypothetical protein
VNFNALTPIRVFDTRPKAAVGTVAVPKTEVGGSTELRVKITGTSGVPGSGVSAVSLNLTATQTTGGGYVTVYPCGARPEASNLNFTAADQTVANAVIAPVSASGEVCVYASYGTHLLADVNGWFAR